MTSPRQRAQSIEAIHPAGIEQDSPAPLYQQRARQINDSWLKIADKSGGANGCGELGGWYVVFDEPVSPETRSAVHSEILHHDNENRVCLDSRGKPIYKSLGMNIGYIQARFPQGNYKLVFCKQDSEPNKIHHDKNIAEVVAGQMMRWLNGDNANAFAHVYFAMTANWVAPSPTGNDVYVVSEAIPHFEDLYKAAYKYYDSCELIATEAVPTTQTIRELPIQGNSAYVYCGNRLYYLDKKNNTCINVNLKHPRGFMNLLKPDRVSKVLTDEDVTNLSRYTSHTHQRHPVPRDRPKITPTEVQDYVDSGKVENFEAVILSCLWTGNVDVHSANVGVVPLAGTTKKKAVTIDFAAAFKDIDDKMNFGSFFKYLPGFGPTNHARDYKRDSLVTKEAIFFLDKLAALSKEDIQKKLNEVMIYVAQHYDLAPLKEFAKWIGLPSDRLNGLDKASLSRDMVKYLSQKLYKRTLDAFYLSMEFKVSLCFDKKMQCNLRHLDELIDQNRWYFVEHLRTGRDFHFRLPHLKNARRYLSAVLHKRIKRNEAALEFISLHPFIEPLSKRWARAFHLVFHGGKQKEARLAGDSGFTYFIKSMFGWPANRNAYSFAEWVFPGFLGVAPLLKNLVKLAVEFVPFFLEELMHFAADHCKQYVAEQSRLSVAQQQRGLKAMALIGFGVSKIFQFAFKAVRFLTMRITSPIRSIHHAYGLGTQLGGKVFSGHPRLIQASGLLLAGFSIAVTVAATIALAVFASPLMAAVSAKMATTLVGGKIMSALSTATHWFMTNAPHVSHAIGQTGIFTQSAINLIGLKSIAGVSFTEALTGMAAAISATYLAVALPARAAIKTIGGAVSEWLGLSSPNLMVFRPETPSAQASPGVSPPLSHSGSDPFLRRNSSADIFQGLSAGRPASGSIPQEEFIAPPSPPLGRQIEIAEEESSEDELPIMRRIPR